MEMIFQLLVLGFTAYVWWLARRDLSQRATEISGPATQEWERLQATVQTLIADLERRATLAEQRVTAAEQRMAAMEVRPGTGEYSPVPAMPSAVSAPPISGETLYPEAERVAHDERYASVYALADAGVTDAAEIARRTGLAYGEVALVLGLYVRQSSR